MARIDGVLLLDKPAGLSSNAALQRARRLLGADKGGHTGTLDPFASGLLPLCFGEATKFSQYHLDADKSYHACLRLGQRTTTADPEGEVVETRPVEVDRARIEAVLADFTGVIEQVPPMHSALKYRGKALYHYARQGVVIERPSRCVTIHHIGMISFSGHALEIVVRCSKGTYIRVLAEDIGAALGCGAFLQALRRLSSGGYHLDRAVDLERLEALAPEMRARNLLPMESLIERLAILSLTPMQERALFWGQVGEVVAAEGLYRLHDHLGRLLGLGEVTANGLLRSKRLVSRESAA